MFLRILAKKGNTCYCWCGVEFNNVEYKVLISVVFKWEFYMYSCWLWCLICSIQYSFSMF